MVRVVEDVKEDLRRALAEKESELYKALLVERRLMEAAAELPKAAKHLAMLKARWAKKSKPKEQVGEKVQETSMDLATFERDSTVQLPHLRHRTRRSAQMMACLV